MHHSIKLDEIKADRDRLFAEYWEDQIVGLNDTPKCNQLESMFCEIAEHAFQKGFVHGITVGAKQGAQSMAAIIHADLTDLMDMPE